MNTFRVIKKLWPAGTEIDPGPTPDSQTFNPHGDFLRIAEAWETPDGVTRYQFLFWNTGRHITPKRTVRWSFDRDGWGTWTATKWYGTPGPGDGPPRVRADAFTIGGDMRVTDTPIDGVASTFAAGAWPSGEDDHVISTVAGGANVVAKNPFEGYHWAGWVQLIWGGDPVGTYEETDTGTTGSFGGGPDWYTPPTTGPFAAPMGTSADLLSTYGYHEIAVLPIIPQVYALIPQIQISPQGDVGPVDVNRLKHLQQLLRQTKPGEMSGADFQSLIEAAPRMSHEELKRTTQSLRTSLELGQTALATMEARLKKQGR